MSRDYLTIGPVPYEEDCAQVGIDNYMARSSLECIAFASQLRRVFGREPEGARIGVKSFQHDFGTYQEVVVWYDTSKPESVEYALLIEANMPAHWDDRASLALAANR